MAPLGCGLQTGAGTVMNSLKVAKGTGIAIFGTGAVGLAAVMAARIVGAKPIIGVDIRPKRLKLAMELGATHVINNRRDKVASCITDITGSGVDYVVETTASGKMRRLAIDVLNPHGTVALLTGESGTALPEGRRTIGIIQGEAVPQLFIPKLIALHKMGMFPFDRLVKFYDFSEINKAIADAKSGDTIKPVLRISKA
jgi:aryl-alcohol dehydrogenase